MLSCVPPYQVYWGVVTFAVIAAVISIGEVITFLWFLAAGVTALLANKNEVSSKELQELHSKYIQTNPVICTSIL